MSNNVWSDRSNSKIITCHKDIQTIFNAVLSIHDCIVLCGNRNKQKQDEYFNSVPKKSKLQYPHSKHNTLPSLAIDCAPYINGDISFDTKESVRFGGVVLTIAEILYRSGDIEHKIRWGGTWSIDIHAPFAGFLDLHHFELYKPE